MNSTNDSDRGAKRLPGIYSMGDYFIGLVQGPNIKEHIAVGPRGG